MLQAANIYLFNPLGAKAHKSVKIYNFLDKLFNQLTAILRVFIFPASRH